MKKIMKWMIKELIRKNKDLDKNLMRIAESLGKYRDASKAQLDALAKMTIGISRLQRENEELKESLQSTDKTLRVYLERNKQLEDILCMQDTMPTIWAARDVTPRGDVYLFYNKPTLAKGHTYIESDDKGTIDVTDKEEFDFIKESECREFRLIEVKR